MYVNMGEMICRHLRKKASRWARGCPGSGTDQFGRIILMGIQWELMGISWGFHEDVVGFDVSRI